MRTLFALLLLSSSASAFAEDACQLQLPRSLHGAVEKAFPGFRTPLVTDNLREDVEWYIRDKRNPCLGVAIADFDGNGSKDFLLGLTAKSGEAAIVVVAFSDKNKWRFDKLNQWKDGRDRLYVSADKPGTYSRTEALEGPLGNNEMSPLTCKQPFAVFGATESTGVAYCFLDGQWKHVWIAD